MLLMEYAVREIKCSVATLFKGLLKHFISLTAGLKC